MHSFREQQIIAANPEVHDAPMQSNAAGWNGEEIAMWYGDQAGLTGGYGEAPFARHAPTF